MPTPATEAACDAPCGDSSSSCAAARDEMSASATQAPARANTRYETRSMWAVGSWSGTASVDRWIRYLRDDETQLRLARRDHRYHVPPIAAVSLEVAIEREHHALQFELAHAHETRIGERHGHVRIPRDELPNRRDLGANPKLDADDVGGDEREHRLGAAVYASQEKAGFGEHRRAREDRRRDRVEHRPRPWMVVIPPIEQRNERPGIEENPRHFP